MSDIVRQIDEVIRRNTERFDPFGPPPPPVPVKGGIEEEAVVPEAAVGPAASGPRPTIHIDPHEVEYVPPLCVLVCTRLLPHNGRCQDERPTPDSAKCHAGDDAPPVAAALQPAADEVDCCGDRAELLFGYIGFCTLPAGHVDAHQDDNGTMWTERRAVDDIATPQARPWWRRFLPGGTR